MIAAEQSSRRVTSHVLSVAKFERFFRTAARLNVDKQDLKRHSDFINEKIYDLLIRAQAAAKANGRAIIEPFDLPITKGLQESVHEFKKIDGQIELQPILDQLTARPPLDLAYSDETESRLPEVVGAATDLMNEAHEAGNIAEVILARRLQQLGCPVEIRRFDVLADDRRQCGRPRGALCRYLCGAAPQWCDGSRAAGRSVGGRNVPVSESAQPEVMAAQTGLSI
jgi:hypothetical protein